MAPDFETARKALPAMSLAAVRATVSGSAFSTKIVRRAGAVAHSVRAPSDEPPVPTAKILEPRPDRLRAAASIAGKSSSRKAWRISGAPSACSLRSRCRAAQASPHTASKPASGSPPAPHAAEKMPEMSCE